MPGRFAGRWLALGIALAALTGCGARKEPGDTAPTDGEPPLVESFVDHLCGADGPSRVPRSSCTGERCVVEGHPQGKEVVYLWLDEGNLQSADLLLQDIWPIPRFAPVALPQPLTWREDPYGEKYWRFIFYSLRPTTHLLWAFRETGDVRYRDKLIDVFRSFAAAAAPSPYTWDKHGVAFRAMVLVNAYWKLKHLGALSAEEANLLEELVRADGVFLAVPENFEGGYNHGFAEAMALLLIAENFPGWPESPGWRELARTRYDGLLTNVIAPDGVIIENSAYYHFYVLAQVGYLVRWARIFNVAPPAQLLPTVARMARFGAHLVQPNGRIPMLGASLARQVRKYEPRILSELGGPYPEFGHMLSAGRCGTAPADPLAVFPESGLAILRSGFGPPEEYAAHTHLVFDAGPYRTDHSHLDALSVHLYSAGRTLLTDPGLFTEEEGPEKDYFQGTRAHNTVTVDGMDQQAGAAVLGLTARGDGWLYQSGAHALYAGVRHWRAVLLLERDVVLVLDQLAAEAPRRFEQRWHFPPNLTVALQGTTATATSQGGQQVLRVLQALPEGLEASTVRGATEPLDGWYTEKYEVKEETTVLLYPRQGSEARYATLFASGPHAVAPAHISGTASAGALEVEACAAGKRYHVRVAQAGRPEESVTVSASADACQGG